MAGQGELDMLGVLERIAEVGPRPGVVGGKLERLPVAGDRRVYLAIRAQEDAACVPYLPIVRAMRQRLASALVRFGVAPRLEMRRGLGEKTPSLRVSRVARRCRSVAPLFGHRGMPGRHGTRGLSCQTRPAGSSRCGHASSRCRSAANTDSNIATASTPVFG